MLDQLSPFFDSKLRIRNLGTPLDACAACAKEVCSSCEKGDHP